MGYGPSERAATGQCTGRQLGEQLATQTRQEPPARQSMIAEQMLMLEQRAEQLGFLVTEIEERIAAVLMPEPPASNAKEGFSQLPGVALGVSIGQINDRLSTIAIRLRGIIQRVEL